MRTEPSYAEVLAHIEQVDAARRARAEAAAAEAEHRRALVDPDAPPKGAAGLGDLA
jgi:hypothetical protein